MPKNCCLIIKKLFYILINNPPFFFKRIFLELKSFILPIPKSPGFKKINGVLFDFNFGYSDKIKQMYVGSYQPIISEIFRKYLKKGDTFIDIGANIGCLSAIAAGYVGENGQVHSFEPVPEYFRKLNALSKMNSRYNIVTNQFALGEKEELSKIYIEGPSDIGNNTFLPDSFDMDVKKSKIIQVPVRRLDSYIKEKGLNNIKLIKIDVEGFEFPVLKGLSDYFAGCSRAGFCPPIICEIIPSAYSHLGYKVRDLLDYMSKFSYYPFEILNTRKRININKIEKEPIKDVLFKLCKQLI